MTKPISKRITIIENKPSEFSQISTWLDKASNENKPFLVYITNDLSGMRTNAQNALYACYVKEIGNKFGESIEEVRRRLKREFGLDILLEQSAEKNKKDLPTKGALESLKIMDLLRAISYRLLNWKRQEKVLESLPCTSIMTSKNFVEFLKRIEIHYAQKGLVLESINETLRNEALLN